MARLGSRAMPKFGNAALGFVQSVLAFVFVFVCWPARPDAWAEIKWIDIYLGWEKERVLVG